MYRNWPVVETGVRQVKMSDLSEGIPRKLFVGPYPSESRYQGQVPQCNRCGEYGHRVATCINDIKCFQCGQEGHVQRECFKCFLCGQFGHVRARCPDKPSDHTVGGSRADTSDPVNHPGGARPAVVTDTARRSVDDRSVVPPDPSGRRAGDTAAASTNPPNGPVEDRSVNPANRPVDDPVPVTPTVSSNQRVHTSLLDPGPNGIDLPPQPGYGMY